MICYRLVSPESREAIANGEIAKDSIPEFYLDSTAIVDKDIDTENAKQVKDEESTSLQEISQIASDIHLNKDNEKKTREKSREKKEKKHNKHKKSSKKHSKPKSKEYYC